MTSVAEIRSVKEWPLPFTGLMVRAILDGRKTQTRRPLSVLPNAKVGDRLWVRETWGSTDADHPRCFNGRKPQPGDRLVYQANPADNYQWGSGLPSQGSFCWRSSIHMPRWASRILLEITEIRVEQVQDISYSDALDEGVADSCETCGYTLRDAQFHMDHHLCVAQGGKELHATKVFKGLWNSIYAKRGLGWSTNPEIRVVCFKVLEGKP